MYIKPVHVQPSAHMGQISQPQRKDAAAGEKRDIGPVWMGPI